MLFVFLSLRAATMPIILFEDHLADVQSQLQKAHKLRESTTLLKSFLEQAYLALRDEVQSLPRELRLDIPTFDSVYDLGQRCSSIQDSRLDVSAALLCVCQLAHFIA